MYSKEAIQGLIQARLAGIRQASEKRDVEELMSWHAKDATFTDVGKAVPESAETEAQLIRTNPVNNISLEGIDAVREFYTQAYRAFPTFRISNEGTTGFTPEFVACEMKCEGEAGIDLPHLGAKTGETLSWTGVSLFWYRWEGSGEEWDGSLSEEAVRGWKIIRERAYHVNSKKPSG